MYVKEKESLEKDSVDFFFFLVSCLFSGLYRDLHDSQISADFENNFEKT
jgi:hypothetical protein